MQDIKDFQEGYASLKDVVPYKTKSKSAAEKNKWYQRSVQEAWEEAELRCLQDEVKTLKEQLKVQQRLAAKKAESAAGV